MLRKVLPVVAGTSFVCCGATFIKGVVMETRVCNCEKCIFCTAKCVRCGSTKVRFDFGIGFEIWNHDKRDKNPIVLWWDTKWIRVRCAESECDYWYDPHHWGPDVGKLKALEAAILDMLKLPTAVQWQEGKVVPISWATERQKAAMRG